MQRVLIVDDDRLVADTLALIFEKNGFKRRLLTPPTRLLPVPRVFSSSSSLRRHHAYT